MAEDLAEASAEATPDFQVAMSGACTPVRPALLASEPCRVPGAGQTLTEQTSTDTSWLTASIIAEGFLHWQRRWLLLRLLSDLEWLRLGELLRLRLLMPLVHS